MNFLSQKDVKGFRNFIYRYFELAGRRHLPWRQNYDPYRILVSEIMLQQTQVDRVIAKFNSFLDAFPSIEVLATAPSSSVVRQWQGLGYNRRGLNLQRAAQTLLNTYQGQMPQSLEELRQLPGIGPYTASAIMAFAFNKPVTVIETNIRTVYIYHFFPEFYEVTDILLLPLIEQTIDRDNPRAWYSALMDYGSYLKQVVPNPTRKSQTYVRQAPLSGSNREVRGKILKVVTQQPVTKKQLYKQVDLETERVDTALAQLIKEHFIENKKGIITLID